MALDEDFCALAPFILIVISVLSTAAQTLAMRRTSTDFTARLGTMIKDEFTITASIVVNGHRTTVDPTSVLKGIEKIEEKPQEEQPKTMFPL
jgi:hypothetical protein